LSACNFRRLDAFLFMEPGEARKQQDEEYKALRDSPLLPKLAVLTTCRAC
jgi:hypothetical protein